MAGVIWELTGGVAVFFFVAFQAANARGEGVSNLAAGAIKTP